MNWLWSRNERELEKEGDAFVKRVKVTRKQKMEEEAAIEFINEVNKEQQGKFVKIARINKTLKDTIVLMERNVVTITERGEQVDDLVDKTEDLEISSRMFLISASAWYWRAFYSIRDLCCCCFFENGRRKKERGERAS